MGRLRRSSMSHAGAGQREKAQKILDDMDEPERRSDSSIQYIRRNAMYAAIGNIDDDIQVAGRRRTRNTTVGIDWSQGGPDAWTPSATIPASKTSMRRMNFPE